MSTGRSQSPDKGVGKPVFVEDQGSFEALVNEALGAPAYFLDTEFHRERTYWPLLALIQITWGGPTYLVDPFAVDVSGLKELLVGGGLAVIHAADQDLEVLSNATGAIPARLFDTQIAAGFLGMSSPSLATLASSFLGAELAKGDRLTDWTRRPLSAAQATYAAGDVEHLPALHQTITDALRNSGRLGWAEDECEVFRVRQRGPVAPEDAWRRLKEARQLKGKARNVAKEVAAWRERLAAEIDRPPRNVLADLAVVAIAHRPPRNEAELHSVRGLEGRSLRKGAAKEILEAVERGMAAKEELRMGAPDVLDRSLRPAAALAAALVSALAEELSLDPALLATRADINSFLRGDPSGRLGKGWRNEVLGAHLADVVSGRASLALDGGQIVVEARKTQDAPPSEA